MEEGCLGQVNEYFESGRVCEICSDLKRCVNICLETNKERWDENAEHDSM